MIKRANTLTAMTAIFLTAGLAHADIDVAWPTAQGRSCSEARQAAWFLDELARTDGNVEPATPDVACDASGQDFGGAVQPVVYRPDGIGATEGPSCKEAREAAWFLNELARSDGNPAPEAPYVACDTDRRHYAEFGLDAD